MPTKSRPFSTPTLVGERFETDSPAIPIDALTELIAYNEIIVGLAKELVRTRLNLTRVPKGFTRRFELRLAGIEKGSAVARLERVVQTDEDGALLAGEPDDFDRGEQVLTDGIDHVNRTGRLPETFPSNVIPLFRKFGRSLRDDEAFVLREASNDTPAVRYTSETRKRLVLLTSDTYSREVDLSGWLASVDVEEKTFRFRPSDTYYGVINVPFPSALRTQLIKALEDYRFTRIQVTGIANFNSADAFVDFEDPPTVTLESDLSEDDVADVESQLREFEELKQGWLDGEEGEVPSKDGLAWLRGILLTLMASYGVPSPYLYPTPEGGVQAEWTFKPWEVSAEFNLVEKTAYLHAVKAKTHQTEARDVGFGADEDVALGATSAFVLSMKMRQEPV
ncbi:hypothetical protein D7X74_21335 [Corallococcus sp. CA047B]|uniref:hypothetical protein n=1 Tax=Corallococcus sp. CA047B TaxID=2316729 RepID=UPI000EA21682|nr:hypothetical protein [Corallococcus sp. CA047B]RKH13793.1 hypothetical protein D7X74_21335 [Corallococcus sp. CA047B]